MYWIAGEVGVANASPVDSTEADKGHELSLPSCRFRVVACELSLASCRFQVVASELSLPFLEGHILLQCEREGGGGGTGENFKNPPS